jgi:hypothetical protein
MGVAIDGEKEEYALSGKPKKPALKETAMAKHGDDEYADDPVRKASRYESARALGT